MMTRFWEWAHSWWVTLNIKYREPDLYRELQEPIDPEDFTEVERPNG